MNDKLTIPAFDAADPTTIIRVNGARLNKSIRVGGNNLVRLHMRSPADAANGLAAEEQEAAIAAEQAKGWPLNPHATVPEQGEAYVFNEDNGCAYTCWLTSDAGSEVYVMTNA